MEAEDYEKQYGQVETPNVNPRLCEARRTSLRTLVIRMRPSGRQNCGWRTRSYKLSNLNELSMAERVGFATVVGPPGQ